MELFSIFQNLTQTEREGRKNVNAKVLELLDKILNIFLVLNSAIFLLLLDILMVRGLFW